MYQSRCYFNRPDEHNLLFCGDSGQRDQSLIGYESVPSAEVSAAVIASKLPAQWAQTVTAGSNQSSFNSVSEASDGSVYAVGYITGTSIYSFGSVTAAGTYATGINAVLVKYDSSGVAQWAQTVTAGVDDSYFYSVSVASDGSVYAAGYIEWTRRF